ncbi:MAG: S-layer homology domain-containing protein [Syntrophomonas sp.]|nr:S-layer homology domain-containing protein [Syntrophomonas sp.]
MYVMSKRISLISITLGLVVFWGVLVLLPQSVLAETELIITISDPDKTAADTVDCEGNTLNTVLENPVVSYGDNRKLGTVRISGKPGIAVPVSPGQKIKVSLPAGTAYMQMATAENYREYAEWPEKIDGKDNKIKDKKDQPGMKFVSASPSSLTLEVGNVDTSGEIMVLDIVFNKADYSMVRLAPFVEQAAVYSGDVQTKVSRMEFFSLMYGVIQPFSSSSLQVNKTVPGLDEKFSDTGDISPADKDKIAWLVNAGYINGYEGGYLRPYQNITRAEAVAVLGKVFGSPGGKAVFNDEIPGWAQTGVNSAYAAKIIYGYPDGSFRPEQQLSRDETISLLQYSLETYSKPNL